MLIKRVTDIIFSLAGIIITLPLLLLISLIIVIESRGGVFFLQKRVGEKNKDFMLFKFRSMYVDSYKKGLLTLGANDSRITKTGYYLRKYKIDELPQLINVLIGNMSIVGPRPEVRYYVDMYSPDQLKVLTIKPGLTDYASLKYINENELLQKSENPQELYIKEIMPEKLKLNLKYITEQNFILDLKIILKTLFKIIG